MHISEGVLSGPVLISSAALAAVGTGIGLKKLDYDQIAKAGMLSAAFFVASLIHVPIGPSNAHLILNGLVGILLGWAAFPVILVALVLHGVFFQFGGITTLGINTIIMALPAVICYLVFGRMIHKSSRVAAIGAFFTGLLSVLLSGVIVGLALIFTEENFLEVSGLIIAAHIPVMIIEGIVTAACVAFLRRVRPEMLPGFPG
jgi:cobalt/nickel transport system permease protein